MSLSVYVSVCLYMFLSCACLYCMPVCDSVWMFLFMNCASKVSLRWLNKVSIYLSIYLSIHTTKTKLFHTQNSPRRTDTKHSAKWLKKLSPDWFHTLTNHWEASYDDYRPFSNTPHVKSSALCSILRLTRFRIAHARREIWVRGACQKPIERMKLIKGM